MKAKDRSDVACAALVSVVERAVETAMAQGASRSAIKRTVTATMKRITEESGASR